MKISTSPIKTEKKNTSLPMTEACTRISKFCTFFDVIGPRRWPTSSSHTNFYSCTLHFPKRKHSRIFEVVREVRITRKKSTYLYSQFAPIILKKVWVCGSFKCFLLLAGVEFKNIAYLIKLEKIFKSTRHSRKFFAKKKKHAKFMKNNTIGLEYDIPNVNNPWRKIKTVQSIHLRWVR